MERKIKELRDHTILCGYGKIGRHVADSFKAENVPFIVIDKELQDEESLVGRGILFIKGDGADEAVLKEAGKDGEVVFIDGSELTGDARAHSEHDVRIIKKKVEKTN